MSKMISFRNNYHLHILGLTWISLLGVIKTAEFVAEPNDFEVVVGENVTFTWKHDVRWLTVGKGRISFGLVNENGTEYQAILVKTIAYTRLGTVQVQVIKNPASNDSEFSSLRSRTSTENDPTAQFTISNISKKDGKKYFCQLNIGKSAMPTDRGSVSLKVVDLTLDKEQSSTEVTSWIDHRVFLVCSVRAAPYVRPIFSWHKKHDRTSVLRATQSNTLTQSVLAIVTSNEDVFGSYVCTARTPKTKVTHEIPIRKLEKPGKVTNLGLKQFINQTGKFVRLSWSPPEQDGGAPILHYVVKYKQKKYPPQGWSMAERMETEERHIVLKQINQDIDMYDVRVRAKSKVGHGEVLDYVLNFATPIIVKFSSAPSEKRLFVGEDALFEWKFKVHPPEGIRAITFGVEHEGELLGIIVKEIKHSGPPKEPMYNGDRSFPTSWFQPRMAAVKNRQASFALFDVAVNDTGNFYCKLSLGRQKRSLTKKVYLKVDDVKIKKDESTTTAESWFGNEMRVTCGVTAAPGAKPVFSWARGADNKTLSKGKHIDTPDKSYLTYVTNAPQDFNTSGFVCTVSTPSTTVRHVVKVKRLYEPMAPTGLQAVTYNHPKQGRVVKLSWDPPTDVGKTPITMYLIEYKTPEDRWKGTVLMEIETPVFEISAVGDESQPYHVRVQAVNKVGKGPPSEYITVTFDPTPEVRLRSKNSSNQLYSSLGTLLCAWLLFLASCKR